VKDYDRYYCYKDEEYAEEELGNESASEEKAPLSPSVAPPFDDLFGVHLEALREAESSPEPEASAAVEEPAKAETPVVPPTPSPSEPDSDSTPAPEPQPEPTPAPSETSAMEPFKEAAAPPSPRPPLVKEEIMKAKKTTLMDLSGAYGLDTMGTKEELRVRLLAEYNRLRREEARATGSAQPSITEPAAGERPESQPRSFLDSHAPEPFESSARAIPADAVSTTHPQSASNPDAVTVGEDLVRSQAVLLPATPKIINPCPTCGRELAYIEPYDRYYCEHCKAYAPPPVKVVEVPPPPRVGQPCPTCGRELTYIEQYDRHYCYNCKAYTTLESRAGAPPPLPATKIVEPKLETHEPEGKNSCPTCAKELAYIARYARYYCYECEKYAAPRPKDPCPNCGKALTYVTQYRRHYCYACALYAPADLSARILAERAATPATAAGSAPRVGAIARPITVHRHGSVSEPLGLAVAGLALILVFQVLVALPIAMGVQPYVDLDRPIAWFIQFLGFLLLGVGATAGLLRLRNRK